MSRNSRNIKSDPYSYVTDDALLFIETGNLPGFLNTLTEGNRIFTELESIKNFDEETAGLKFCRDLINSNDLSTFFENARSVVSVHIAADGNLFPFISIQIPVNAGQKSIAKLLRSATGGKMTETRKNGIKLYGIPMDSGAKGDTIYIILQSGLLLSSTSSDFLVNSVKSYIPENNIRSLPGITRLIGAAGRNEDKVFLIFRNFSQLLRKAENDNSHQLSDSFKRLASGLEGDLFINENGLILSGYSESVDSSEIIYKFKSNQGGELNSRDALPTSVILFETFLIQQGSLSQKVIPNKADTIKWNETDLIPFLGDEVTRALIDLRVDSGGINQVILYELKNRNMAEQIVNQRLSDIKEKTGLHEYSILEYFQPDDQVKIPIYRSPFKNLASFVNAGLSAENGDTILAFIDNFMVTGNSVGAINKVLYDNILKKTLANDLIYREFESTLPSRAGYYFFCKPADVTVYLDKWLNSKVSSWLSGNIDHIKKITAVGFQLAASNGMVYNSLSVKFGDEVREESGAEWETLLDTVASIKPFFFTNHNTGSREIFIQDFRNRVYLVNSAGRVLWKLALNERIQGPVYMIDYYGNGKFQLLFAGKNWLHLIDRNGNYVERYPVRLRSAASGPPSLFDYDGTNEYRILIPGEDRLIYAYDKSGNVVKGWKPFLTTGTVRDGLKFFRISGKDYLIAADNSNVYFIDRTGNTRLKVKEPVTKAKGSEIRLNTGREPGIIFTSPEGSVTVVNFDGKVSKFDLGGFTVDHTFDFFDIDGDGFGEYIFIDKGKLYLYDHDRTPVFVKDFNTSLLEGPISFTFSSSDKKIGVFDRNKKLIYIVDRNGNIMNGFPLRGASVFSIGKLSEKSDFHLIVGGDDNFLYNYKLNREANR